MIRAVVSDIHGNLEALETVLADIERRGITSVACLGDFVGYGAAPNQCIDLVRPRIETAVIGNHDLAAIGRLKLGYFNHEAAVAARWTDATLTEENRLYLESLPYTVEWHGIKLVHASPLEPGEWNYVLSPADAEAEMEAYEQTVCLIGHSHYPGAFDHDGRHVTYSRLPEVRLRDRHRYLVNVGSVGQPRDGDPRSAYLVVDEERRTLTHVRLEYDVARAMDRIRGASLPAFLAERLQWGE